MLPVLGGDRGTSEDVGSGPQRAKIGQKAITAEKGDILDKVRGAETASFEEAFLELILPKRVRSAGDLCRSAMKA